MEEQYKKVWGIQLYDAGRTLYSDVENEGDIFGDFCTGKSFVIEGKVLKQIIKMFNIPFNSQVESFQGKNGPVYEDLEFMGFEIAKENLNTTYGIWSPPDAIYAIETPSILKIKLERKNKDGTVGYDYISYKGNYAIGWESD